MKRIFFFVNGIRTWPGDDRNWTGRAVTATHTRTEHKAEKVEYVSLALLRPLAQARRARKLVRVQSFYNGWERILVVHSNGADVVLDALEKQPFGIHHLILISPAVPAKEASEQLRRLMEAKLIHTCEIWVGKKDFPLHMASWFVVARLLGYGTLGLSGPLIGNWDPATLSRLSVRTVPKFGHSDWFADEHFDETMGRIWQAGPTKESVVTTAETETVQNVSPSA